MNGGKSELSANRNLVGGFMIVQAFPFVVYFLVLKFSKIVNVSTVVFSLALIFESWLVKRNFAWNMVGISWSIECGVGGSLIKFDSKPSPFVPVFALANIFWVGSFISLVIWALAAFINLFERRWLGLAFALLGFAVQLLNLSLFMKAHQESQKLSAEIARAAILNDSIEFPLVKEDQDFEEHESGSKSDAEVV